MNAGCIAVNKIAHNIVLRLKLEIKEYNEQNFLTWILFLSPEIQYVKLDWYYN